jgi:tetratricopeptide (TPR) repeat protein
VSFDRTKSMQVAQKYLAKGQFDRAIGEYERMVQADPKDARLLLKLGDLYTRQGSSRDASATYRKVADQYAEQGFFLKAVAVCKQILKLDPNQLDVWERLAEMYEMLSLVSDAIQTYEQVADAHTRAGNPRKALKALQKAAELDSENVASRIRYAEALSKLNKPDEAAAAFRDGAQLLRKQGRLDDFLKVGERLLFHQPDDYEFARELAAIYLERGDAKHALVKLQLCFNADPKNLDTLMLLARAFEQLGQTQKTVSVLKEVARLHQAEARQAELGSVLRRILTLDPNDREARRDLSQMKRLPTEQPPAAIEVEDEDYDLVLEDDLEPATGANEAHRSEDGELDPQARAEVQRLLEECNVFIRYGLTEKMITQLQEVLSIDPRHVDARTKLKDAFLKARRPQDAVEQLIELANLVAADDRERAEDFLSEAIRLDPKSADAKRLLNELANTVDSEEVVFLDEAMPGHLEDSATDEFGDGSRPEESFASVMPPSDARRRAPVQVALSDDDDASDQEEYELVMDDAVDSSDADAVILDGEDQDDHDGVMIVDDASEPELEAAPAEEPEDLPEDLREAVEEIDFYLKQNMAGEARATLGDALQNYPEHPLLLRYQQQLPAAEPSSLPPPLRAAVSRAPEIKLPPPKAAAQPDRSFELAQKLAEEVAQPVAIAGPSAGAGPVELADVLAQFKRGVAKQVDASDTATHYDLGIAYMEMGLHAEAIDEFNLCLGDPTRRCTAHTMLGLSYVAKGDMDLGIEHFNLALVGTPKPEEELSLWFELGNAYELTGKNMDALIWYEKVEERDPHFRDVNQRIERLGTARTPEQEADDFDEMFDNMILKE